MGGKEKDQGREGGERKGEKERAERNKLGLRWNYNKYNNIISVRLGPGDNHSN